MVFATIQPISTTTSAFDFQNGLEATIDEEEVNKEKESKYFCVSTLDEVEDTIRKHAEDTYSHFVVAKKTKAYGTSGQNLSMSKIKRVASKTWRCDFLLLLGFLSEIPFSICM